MSLTIRFPPFHLDAESGQLWRGNDAIPLRPKAYSVLRHLAERPGRLVTKDELLDAVWPETHVSDGVLKVCIRELRQALGDTAKTPAFIETLHRRGYRFVGDVQHDASDSEAVSPTTDLPPMVGRAPERADLRERLERARGGARQIIFVTGSPGIGKTTLVDAALADVAMSKDPVWIARGQCVEQYGAGEAFLPVLEALGRLGRGAAGAHVIGLLREHAPSWLLQLPGLIGPGERDTLRREYAGSGPERMLRELVVGLEAICAVQPLVLVLEDLHWSDASTIDLLSAVARGRATARLLVIGTLRPADAMAAGHPLSRVVRELSTRHQAAEISLHPLDEVAVGQYLRDRFDDDEVTELLRGALYRRTEGHPLFLVNVTDHLVRDGSVAQTDTGWRVDADVDRLENLTPASLTDVLASQLDRLDAAERRTLAAASLIGQEFASPTLAAALEEDTESVEKRCEALARRDEFLGRLPEREWPDGTTAARYVFHHSLYRETLSTELAPAERKRIHRLIGDRLEAGFGGHEAEIATQLALHFERGGDVWRAVRYLHLAGDRATSRHAYAAAVDHLNRALELLATLDEDPKRVETELILRVSLGAPLLNSRGFGAPEVEATYARALELCAQTGETPQLFPVLMGLQAYYSQAGELPRAHELSRQVVRLSEQVDDRVMRLEGHHALGCDLLRLAELDDSIRSLETAVDLIDPSEAGEAYRLTGHDPKTCCLCNLAIAKHFIGRPDEALRMSRSALTWAQEIRLPFSLVQAHVTCAWVHLLRFEPDEARAAIGQALRLCDDYDMLYWRAVSVLLDAWGLGQSAKLDEACARVEEGWEIARLMGPRTCEAEYRVIRAGLVATVRPSMREIDAIDETIALLDGRGERIHRPELERQRGELLLRVGREGDENDAAAGVWFRRSLESARALGTRHLELKAACALVSHRERIGADGTVVDSLREVYDSYQEGLETLDLVIARTLLDA